MKQGPLQLDTSTKVRGTHTLGRPQFWLLVTVQSCLPVCFMGVWRKEANFTPLQHQRSEPVV